MDPNMSLIILNPVINATLNQSLQPSWTPLISPLSVLAGAFVGLFASLVGLHLKEKQDRRKMRRQIVSRLRGCQRLLSNLYGAYGLTFIETQRCGAVCKKNLDYLRDRTSEPDKLDQPILESQAYNQYMKSYERTMVLHLELAKCSKDLFEILGLIETLLPVTSDLIKKISLIEK